MDDHHTLTIIFGILGNVISILVYLSPVPTFYRIYKKRSTESFQSLPYLAALFSCTIWLYYALLTPDILLITVNSFGCVAETAYVAMYIAYAPKDKRVAVAKLFGGLNVAAFAFILLLTRFLVTDVKSRMVILGWICVVVSACVFAAPLNILARVMRTRSVEYMPFMLSFFLTLTAVLWSAYGVLQKDKFVAIPNITGFFFGTAQMIVYAIYRNCSENSAAVGDIGNQTKDLKTIVVLGPADKSIVMSTNDDDVQIEIQSKAEMENLGKMDAQVEDDHQPATNLSQEALPGDDDYNHPETEVRTLNVYY